MLLVRQGVPHGVSESGEGPAPMGGPSRIRMLVLCHQ